jgi:type I restriction enzyme S subunit
MNEWVKLKIPDFATIVSGATPATNVSEYWDGEIVWITPNDLSRLRNRFIDTSERKISHQGLKSASTTITPARSVVMSSRAPIGYFGIPTLDFTTNQGCKSFVFSDEHDAEFHYYNFVYNADLFKRYGSGSTFMEISKSNIEKLSFLVPVDIKVQRKIAKILSTVDAVIEKTEAVIEKYQAIKAGTINDLITRGIDIQTGKLRPSFKEAPELYKESELGWIPKEWVVTEFQDACLEFINGGTPSTKNASNWVGSIPWITGADFLESFEVGFIRRQINEDALRYSSSHLIRKGNILLVTRTGVGKLAIAPFDVAISQDITGIILDSSQYCVEFFYYYLQVLVENFKKMNQGTSINGIIRSDLEATLILKPPLVEQKQIAAVLKALDESLKKEQSNQSKYHDLKIGLMADLLTYKVRVIINEDKLENS